MAEIETTFDAADQYERFMGRWSRAIGERFLGWLSPSPGLRWLDLGCGTGAFTELILKRASPASVVGADPAPAQIEQARKQTPAADFQVADATALPFDDASFDVVASALVINFIPDRAKAFSEMNRVLKPGGIVAAYMWKRDATVDFSPHAPMEDAMRQLGVDPMRPSMSPESMPEGARSALGTSGFSDIVTTTIEAPQTYRDFDDYWQAQTVPFAPIGQSVAALSETQREKLRAILRATLPADDGTVTYSSQALAFKARKPA